MFIQTVSSTAPNIKVFRQPITPERVWLKLSDDTLISLSMTEARQIAEGLNREIQEEAAHQVAQA